MPVNRLAATFCAVALALAACGGPAIENSSTCSELTDAMSEQLASLPDGSGPESVDPIYAAAAEQADQILRADPDDPDGDACRRIMRAVKDSESEKLFGD